MFYVDELVEIRTKTRRGRWVPERVCTLTYDENTSEDALHAFASQLDVSREQFTCRPGQYPHYWLSMVQRHRALFAGAVFVPRRVQAQRRLAILARQVLVAP